MAWFAVRCPVWALLLPLAAPAWGQAPPRPMLELLPRSEFGGLLFRDTAELQRRGDELIAAVGVPMSYRPSEMVQFGLKWLGVQQSCDLRQPLGLFVAGHERESFDFEGFVVAVPFLSRVQMMADVRLTAAPGEIGDLQPGQQLGSDFWMRGATDGRYLFLGGGRNREVTTAAVREALSAPRLTEVVSANAARQINAADLLLHIGAREIMTHDRTANSSSLWKIDPQSLDADERPVAEAFAAAAQEVEHLFCTLRLDDGLSAHHRLQFGAGEDSVARKLLRELHGRGDAAAPDTSPSLQGLPAGPVLAAGTARLPAARQQLLLRTLVRLLSSETNTTGSGWLVEWQGGAFTDLRQAVLLGALVEVLPLTSETRFALYPNPDHTASLLVVLETGDPERLVAKLRELSNLMVEGSLENPARPVGERATEADLRKLIRELAADDFAIRSRATTRLLLLGEQARAALTQAAAADDAEVAARAKALLAKFEASATANDQRLLTDNPLVGAHPHLTYHVGAEQVHGRAVDVIQIELPPDEAPRVKQLVQMFGPEWNRVRLSSLDRQVVLSLGTPGGRWYEALDNLAEGRPGLELDSRLVQLEEDPERLIEVHFPLSRLVRENEYRYWNSGPPRDVSPSRALTAVGLSAGDDTVALDLHLPVDELRAVVVKRGWSW